MFRFRKPYLIQSYCFNKKDKLINKSIFAIAEEDKRAKSDEIILIALITIFLLLFFARTLIVFLVLLTSGLIIGIFGLIKERRKK